MNNCASKTGWTTSGEEISLTVSICIIDVFSLSPVGGDPAEVKTCISSRNFCGEELSLFILFPLGLLSSSLLLLLQRFV